MKDQSEWIETMATVVSCRYQFARLHTMTMGVQTGEKFRISFEYYAHGRLYSGEFQSATAIAQAETVPIRYNPLQPGENSYSGSSLLLSGSQVMGAGVAGSIALSLLWLSLMHGCN